MRKVRTVELTRNQQKAYTTLKHDNMISRDRSKMLQHFMLMGRIVDTMAWFDKTDHSSAKLDDCMMLLTHELAEEKVVIFSKFHIVLDELRLRLDKEKISYVNFTGRESREEREHNKNVFNTDVTTRVALITTAAEMGQNLHGAHYMIFLNHIFNPSRMEQLRGRIDRGHEQLSDFICTIHYIAKDTYEEDIIPKLEKEQELMEKVFGMKDDTFELLSDDQLYELIRSGKLMAA